MWPTLVKFGNFEITTFGLMMFVAFVVAGLALTRELRRYGLDEDLGSSMLLAAAIGGILGGKLYYAILYGDIGYLFSRAGMVWYGGLIGGTIAVSIVVLRNRVNYLTAADAVAPPLAIGYALGRIGCFLVGDDYGGPTNAWYGVAFPNGAPPTTASNLRRFGVPVDPAIPGSTVMEVHPTQLYETGMALLMFGFLLFIARRPHVRGRVFGWFLVLLGIERLLVEVVRAKDDRFLGPFTVAQLISAVLIAIGIALLAMRTEKAQREGPQAVPKRARR